MNTYADYEAAVIMHVELGTDIDCKVINQGIQSSHI